MVILVRLVQDWNALSPMVIKPVPRVTVTRGHCLNALNSISVTLLGIVRLVRPHNLNAVEPIIARLEVGAKVRLDKLKHS